MLTACATGTPGWLVEGSGAIEIGGQLRVVALARVPADKPDREKLGHNLEHVASKHAKRLVVRMRQASVSSGSDWFAGDEGARRLETMRDALIGSLRVTDEFKSVEGYYIRGEMNPDVMLEKAKAPPGGRKVLSRWLQDGFRILESEDGRGPG